MQIYLSLAYTFQIIRLSRRESRNDGGSCDFGEKGRERKRIRVETFLIGWRVGLVRSFSVEIKYGAISR